MYFVLNEKKLNTTGDGTNIQNALLQAMNLIADAEKQSGKPLAAANIVLMTDGEAPVDFEQLIQARQAINRKTPLQTMFIAINGSNEHLVKFAMETKKMGVEKGFYREFSADRIRYILNEADTLETEGRHEFYSENSASELPDEIDSLMDQALRLTKNLSEQSHCYNQSTPAREHLQHLEKLKWQETKQIKRPLENCLIKVRQLVKAPVFKNSKTLEIIVHDLIINFKYLTGIAMEDMNNIEQEQLRHLLRYAADVEESVR